MLWRPWISSFGVYTWTGPERFAKQNTVSLEPPPLQKEVERRKPTKSHYKPKR